MDRFDVVVVGARCAGSPLATMLARRGLRVCLLDRSRFPSETLSTHVIQPCGVAVLDRLGVLDTVLEAGAVPLTRFTFVSGDARIDVAIDDGAFDVPALSMRRVALDHLLVEAAASAGADVRTGSAATGLLREDGRVAGVETKRGPVHAQLVVGADGRGSTVARLAGAREYYVAPAGLMFAWAYFDGVEGADGQLLLGTTGEFAYVSSPTDEGLYMAAVCPPMDDRDSFLADREGNFMAGVRAWPELGGLLAGARRVGSIRVMANWHGYFREASGPGWALLGDAGNFKDPSPAQGIADALRQAESLAGAIGAGFEGTAGVDEELRRWWRWRDEDAFEMHWFAANMGVPGPAPPLADQVIRDLADDDAGTEQLLQVLNHEIRPSQLFTPRRLGRAAVRVARHRPGQIPAMAREVGSEVRAQIRQSRERSRAPTPES
jgi:flavin-dependent dehydrogenase